MQTHGKSTKPDTESIVVAPDVGNYTLAGIALGTFIVVFSVFLKTLYPSVPGGDSPELISMAYQLGVAHPPGYPLHTLVAHMFTWLPFGTVAWRCNVLAAVCGAGSATILVVTAATWTGSCGAALLAVGWYAFSADFWLYSIHAEVFAMNNLFVSVILYLGLRYARHHEQGIAYCGAFSLGLALCNQHTIILFGVPIVLFVLGMGHKDLLAPRPLGILTLCFVVGFVPLHAYLFFGPVVEGGWGHTSNLAGLKHHILRGDYGTFQLASNEVHSSTRAMPCPSQHPGCVLQHPQHIHREPCQLHSISAVPPLHPCRAPLLHPCRSPHPT